MTDRALASKLAKLDKNWDSTKEEFGNSTGGIESVPGGTYIVNKVKAELAVSSKNNLMIKRSAKIVEGELEGTTVYDNSMTIETERGPEFLLKWLNVMGYEVDSLKKDLEPTLQAINENEEATYKVLVKEDDGFNKIYFNKCLDEGGTEDGSDADADTDAEDVSRESVEIPDLDSLSGRKLKKVIKDNDIDVDPAEYDDEDDLRDAIEEAFKSKVSSEKKKEEPAKEAKAKHGAPARRKGKAKGPDTEKLNQGLKDICDAFGIGFEDDDSFEEMKKTLAKTKFKKKDLEEAEIEVLEESGLGKNIE